MDMGISMLMWSARGVGSPDTRAVQVMVLRAPAPERGGEGGERAREGLAGESGVARRGACAVFTFGRVILSRTARRGTTFVVAGRSRSPPDPISRIRSCTAGPLSLWGQQRSM